MADGWTFGAPQLGAGAGTMTLVEGVTFCICDSSGDIVPGEEQGLFFRDTRFLSELRLSVDGQGLDTLAAHSPSPYAATFIGRRLPSRGSADSTILVVRRRFVGNGLREDITVRNFGHDPVSVVLKVCAATDFAGLFEVKRGNVVAREGIERSVDSEVLRMWVLQGRESREVMMFGDGPYVAEAASDGPAGTLTWRLGLDPHAEHTVSVAVTTAIDGTEVPPRYPLDQPVEASQPATRLAEWRQSAPALSTPDERLGAVLATSAEDLGALRIFQPEHPDRAVIAAGAPWFMTLFGRDSLLTSWMLLPMDPTLALGTLRTLAELQGTTLRPLTEEEPGRILHEVRSGMAADMVLGEGNVYYGSIDATPLFVMVLGELNRWGIGTADTAQLLPHADRAMDWVERYGDRDGDGFVEYQRATDRGLENQGWKDSHDAIGFAAGELAEPPIALAEVQGYVYASYRAMMHYAREAGDHDAEDHWANRAATLKRRFNEAFWLEERGYFALALDGEKRPVDALASNMGHCLWTGIVDQDKAGLVAEHLLGPAMFTGFGVRTLGSTMAAYNPVSYHNGSVWPHDNAIIAAGLMRYGFVEAAQRIALGLLDAANWLGSRLPELFCGFDRAEFDGPVPYPTSCSPQAWAAAAPLYLLRTLLRFDPWAPGRRIWCDPAVPDRLLPLRIDRLNIAGSAISIEVGEDGWRIDGLPDDIDLVPTARRPVSATAPPRPALLSAGPPGRA